MVSEEHQHRIRELEELRSQLGSPHAAAVLKLLERQITRRSKATEHLSTLYFVSDACVLKRCYVFVPHLSWLLVVVDRLCWIDASLHALRSYLPLPSLSSSSRIRGDRHWLCFKPNTTPCLKLRLSFCRTISECHCSCSKHRNRWRYGERRCYAGLKGQFTQKKKILSFTHPQVDPNLYECVCSAEHKGRYSEEWGKQQYFVSYYGSQWCPPPPQTHSLTHTHTRFDYRQGLTNLIRLCKSLVRDTPTNH